MYFIIAVIFIVLTAILAWWKGYSSSLWFMAVGPLGLLILIFAVPDIKNITDPEEKIKRTKRGNFIGAILTILSLFVIALDFASQAPKTGAFNISFLILIIFTGVVSSGISRECFTFKSSVSRGAGCLFIFGGILMVLLTVSIFLVWGILPMLGFK